MFGIKAMPLEVSQYIDSFLWVLQNSDIFRLVSFDKRPGNSKKSVELEVDILP
jgi:hypothetical protein